MTKFLSRRQALKAALAAPALPAMATSVSADVKETPAAEQPAGICTLLPQAVEGPFYFDPKLMRADIAEGHPGAPLRLELRLIETGPCTPLANARVDVWHADATGIYSGYAGQGRNREISTKGQTYLRGTQMTDADGRVTFMSVYPGWYPGRTPHIHIKVFLDDKSLLTGQIYFPDDFSARVYASRAPYNARSAQDTKNEADGIFRDGKREGGGTVLAMGEDGDIIVATLLIGVDRSGEAAARANRGFFRRLIGI